MKRLGKIEKAKSQHIVGLRLTLNYEIISRVVQSNLRIYTLIQQPCVHFSLDSSNSLKQTVLMDV
jgi:hypothetical protein